jgi:hypothetical protein
MITEIAATAYEQAANLTLLRNRKSKAMTRPLNAMPATKVSAHFMYTFKNQLIFAQLTAHALDP